MKIKHLISTAIPLLLLDIFWLSITAPSFYKDRLGDLLRDNFAIGPAALFYIIFVFGLTYFVVSPAVKNKLTLRKTALNGALFGFVSYATYDLTNLATIINWSVTVTIVDMIWGAILSASASVASMLLIRNFSK